MKKVALAFCISSIFLIVGIATLNDYWISWDSPVHFRRGQTYLQYYLTGEETFKNTYSFYQTNDVLHTGKKLKDQDMGHPPLGDILMATFNRVFFQELRIIGDIEAYNLFIVFTAALIVFFTFLFAYENFGVWPAIFSSLLLFTYPLFWAESHFNVKDVPQTAFFVGFLYFLFNAVKKRKATLLLLGAICAGISMSIKLNILFTVFILGPWILYLFLKDKNKFDFIISKKTISYLIISSLVIIGIFILSWPYLWSDPLGNIAKTLQYYETEGTNIVYQPGFTFGPVNLYPFVWIILTTNLLTLLFLAFGLFTIKKHLESKRAILTLLIFWLIAPIARVTWSRFAIYGGARQILEYIPPMTLLAGLGAEWLRVKMLRRAGLIGGILLLCISSVVLVLPLVKYHPYENTYFNFLIGGLSGAYKKNIPASGNTFGNAYKEGIEWINKNSSSGEKLALIQGATSNIPLFKLRKDIDYNNAYFSGIQRKGEYLMEVYYRFETRDYHYAWEYVDKLLIPVYEVKVDEVPVLKIWKNDMEHTKEEYKKLEKPLNNVTIEINEDKLIINLAQEVVLSRLEANLNTSCETKIPIFVQTTTDGKNWYRQKDWIGSPQIGRDNNFIEKKFSYFFAGVKAKQVSLFPVDDNLNCLNKKSVKVWYLD